MYDKIIYHTNVKERVMSKEKLGTLMAILSAVSFAALSIFSKIVYAGGAKVISVLFIRFAGAALIFWTYFFLKKETVRYNSITVIKLLLLGAVGYGSMSALFLLTVSRIPASLSGMLLCTYPALVSLVTVLCKIEPFSKKKGMALVTTSVGLLAVLGSSFDTVDSLGIIFGLGSATVYTAYIVVGSQVLKPLDPLKSTMYILTGAAITYTVIGLFSGTLSFAYSATTWLALSGIVLISTVTAIAGFWYGVKLIGPSKTSIIGTMEPPVTVLLAWLTFGEVLTPIQFLGGVLIFLGVFILQYQPSNKVQQNCTNE